jgi:(p)ppGpp synthase/HD superfamily hydrolase
MPLTDRFADALVFAERLHRPQSRKGNDVPYVAHLLAVCGTVLEWGGGEDTAIAALLHDAVEDQGGLATLEAIRARYGERVAGIVLACTDSTGADPAAKAPWEERKQAHLAKIRLAGPEVALVTAADKLHNLSAMIRDIRRFGPATLDRFNAKPDRLVWYVRAMAEALAPYAASAPVDEIRAGAEILQRLAIAREGAADAC